MAASRQQKQLRLVMLWLRENGFSAALHALKDESNYEFDEDNEDDRPNALAHAFDLLEEYETGVQQSGFKEEKQLREDMLPNSNQQDLATTLHRRMQDLHQSNIIAVSFSRDVDSTLLASGDASRIVKLTDVSNGDAIRTFDPLPAPVLCLDFNPVHHHLLLCGCMNGSLHILGTHSQSPLQSFKDHSKYLVRVKWSPSGIHFATASHDKTARVYRAITDDPSVGDWRWECIKEMRFLGQVEAVEWLPDGSQLLVSVRGDNYIRFFDVESLQEASALNMNANGDDHVSFSAVDISCNSTGRYLLLCTDRNRMIMYQRESGTQVRNFYGANADSFGNPRCAWSLSERFVYCTSQIDNVVVAWDVLSERVVHKLSGHSKTVRDMARHPTRNLLATGSFDRSVCLWTPASEPE